MSRLFYLYQNKYGTYTAEFLHPETGSRVCFRTVPTKNRDEALLTAAEWARSGIPARKRGRAPIYQIPDTKQSLDAVIGLSGILKGIEKTPDLDTDGAQRIADALRSRGLLNFHTIKHGPEIDFIDYLQTFWDFDNSSYVRDRLAHNHRIGRRYCYEAGKRVERFWKEPFQGRTLASITRKELKDFSLSLADKGFSSGYTNMIINAGIIPLGYAAREGIITHNPAADFERFSHVGPGRGCLTPQEAEKIFSEPWADKRAYVGNLLAMTSGLRHGEILALTKNDIDPEQPILHIRHSWSSKDGLKSPKNGESRKVPVLSEIKQMLIELLEENPHIDKENPTGKENRFLFWGVKPDRPSYEGDFLRWGLSAAMEKAGIDFKARKISFHSHRHFYCARLADKMTAEEVQRISGHKSKAMFDHYADHVINENVLAMGKAGQEVFENILPFKKGA